MSEAPTGARQRALWFVTTGLAAGGAERFLSLLAPALATRGFRPSVWSLRGAGRFGAVLRARGVPVRDLWMGGMGTVPLAALQLAAAARRERPSLVQGWMYHGNLVATLVAWAARAPLAWGIRQSLGDSPRDSLLTQAVIRAGALLSGRPGTILYNSSVSLEQHAAAGYRRERAEVVPNGFDTDSFRPDPSAGPRLRGRIGAPPDALLVGCVARFHPVKGHENLLDAFALLARSRPTWHLVLLGSGTGPDEPRLAAAIARRGLSGRVTGLGESDDVAGILAAFDAFVQASSAEGFPNAVGEAMACGIPVVATRVGDTESLVGDTGVLVPPDDPAALAAGLSSTLDAPTAVRRAAGEAARARVIERFSIGRAADRYAEIYARISSAGANG